MKTQTIIILLAIILASCTPAVTLVSTGNSPPITLTPTVEVIITVTPSPMPTRPTFAAITPDIVQVEGWKEYQSALAKRLMSNLPTEKVLCEWEILGQSAQEVYVWAICTGTVGNNGFFPKGEEPALIQLGVNGSVQSVEIPGAGTHYGRDIQRLFPPDVQDKIFNHLIDYRQLSDHLEWRREHPEEPPWIVFSATPMP